MTGVRSVRTRAVSLAAALLVSLGTLAPSAFVPAQATTGPTSTGQVDGTVSAPDGVRILSADLLTVKDGVWTAVTGLQDDFVDSDGRFEIDDVPAGGGYRLCFDGLGPDASLSGPMGCWGGTFPEQATAVVVPGATRNLSVALSTTPVTVQGRAVSADGALAASVVTLERRTPTGWEADYTDGTDGTAGSYSFSVLPAVYRIRVSPRDGTLAASVSSQVQVTSGCTLADQVLPPARSVAGLVTGPAGAVSGVDVRVLDVNGAVLMTTRSDDQGHYTFTHVPRAAVRLRAAGVEDSTDLQASSLLSVPAGAQDATVDLVLQPGATFTGTLVDADVANADAEVRAWDPSGVYPSRTANVTDTAAGSFTVGGLTPGVRYDVAVDPRDGRGVRYLTSTGDVTLDADAVWPITSGAGFGYVDLQGLSGTVPAPAAGLAGSPAVGSSLSVTPTWTGSVRPSLVQYAWYRGATRVSGPSVGRNSYAVGAADVGQAITVEVIGSLTGYRSARVRLGSATVQAPPAPPAPAVSTPSIAVTRRPAVAGVAKVGKRLTASAGTASPAARASIQWLRNGAPIARATGSAYKLTKADKGRRISVRVTYTRTGYRSASTTSAATGAVKK